MREADRSRRRPSAAPRSHAPRSRSRPDPADTLRVWLPPAIGALVLLVLYVLGNLDVMETPPALAIDAALLILIVLYFPMRYVWRLDAPGRVAAACLAIVWLGVAYYPIYCRIYPGERIASVTARPADLPLRLGTEGRGRRLDLIIEGDLLGAAPGATRVALYSLTVQALGQAPQIFEGEFKESWLRQAQGRKESVELHQARTATTVTVENPANADLRVTGLRVRGHAEKALRLAIYPHRLPPWWVGVGAAFFLLTGAAVFDMATGARDTAASLTIATGAVLTGAFAFPGIGSPQPTFRELVGAAIVGALIGGPIGGIASWLLHGRLPVTAHRARHRAA